MSTATETRQTRLDRVLAVMERAGNRLPHPFMLFVYLLVILAIASTAMAAGGISTRVPGADEPLAVKGVLSGEGLVYFLENFVTNFVSFPPLGTVLVMVVAIGVAERSGLLRDSMAVTLGRLPAWLLPYGVAFVAAQGHVMSDASFLIIPPLAAIVFKTAGRHPVAGLIGGFACTTAGYAGGVLVGALDALLAGITTAAMQIIPVSGATTVTIASNYYFAAASGLILPLVGGFLIDRVLEPRLGPWKELDSPDPDAEAAAPVRTRALLLTLLFLCAYIALCLLAWLLPGGPLQGEDGDLVKSPFLSSVVPLLAGAFLLAGVLYGVLTKSLTNSETVPNMMGEAVKELSGYIVFIFIAAQFIALFTWTNVGTWLAVRCAATLEGIGLTGFLAIIGLVLIASFVNLFIISGSAMWSLLAPVAIPVFLVLGYEPGFIQAAYRIGDSTTQVITPLNPYIVVLLGFVHRYMPEMKFGTLLSRLAIFVVPFWVTWIALLACFYFFDIPVGPGISSHIAGN